MSNIPKYKYRSANMRPLYGWFRPEVEFKLIAPDTIETPKPLPKQIQEDAELLQITDITDDRGFPEVEKFLKKHKMSMKTLNKKGILYEDIAHALRTMPEGEVVAQLKVEN